MKQTSDNKNVPDYCWYYLLAFNDKDNWKLLYEMFGVMKLHVLTYEQFWQLFEAATRQDFIESKVKSVTQK
jgi:hypothetical protein